MVSFGIENQLGLYAFLSLIPLIILYLIRPKPKSMEIPSLMFFLKARSNPEKRSFFRTFTRDWLMVLQLLVLTFIAASLASPYLITKQDVVSDNVILVLDASASSKVHETYGIRFEKIKEKAKEVLGNQNTIIVIKGSSLIGIKDKSSDEAIKYIDALQPTDTRSKIGDAILLAGDLIKEKGRVVVVSDFLNTEGTPIETAKNIVESKGTPVDLVNVINSRRDNFGIVQIKADEKETNVYIKNYKKTNDNIQVDVDGKPRNLFIKGGNIETINYLTKPGISRIELLSKDDFDVDDLAYVSAPLDIPIKVAYISNNPSFFMKSALNSIKNIRIDYFAPPIMPEDKYDIYILQGIAPEKVLAGSFDDLKKKVDDGASLVIYGQEDMKPIRYGDISPVEIVTLEGKGIVSVNQLNRFTRDMEFGRVEGYFRTNLKESISIAAVDNNSVIALKSIGKGKILYYGLMDDYSDFKLSPYYPIFWNNALKFLTNQKEISGLNFKAGDILTLEKEENVKTPSKEIKANSLSLDEDGIYEIGDKKIAVNLISQDESDINVKERTIGENAGSYVIKPVKEDVNTNLEIPLIILVMLILLTEIIYIKKRGDIWLSEYYIGLLKGLK